MEKVYNPKQLEAKIYQKWNDLDAFKVTLDETKPNYSIVIPPPNVTGSLHMGHAFQNTIMDALSRYKRMTGYNVLLQPGLDHAGIATQMVVERKLQSELGKSRLDFSREEFIEKIWEWKEHSANRITSQFERLGCSMDWDRLAFTMDQERSQAVRKVFVELYRDGLIYKGKRLVNWDPKLTTAISDLEIENKEVQGQIWYFNYQLVDATTQDNKNYLTVATTRPETILGDVAVAVNPEDPRYQHLIGSEVIIPILNRKIPVIADSYVDKEFGTGVVKITPAHDFNDYQVGKRHNLPLINIFSLTAHVLDQVEVFDFSSQPLDITAYPIPSQYCGLERYQARKLLVSEFEAANALEKIEKHANKVPYGDRSGVPIEPLLTDQWYVNAQKLAIPAIDAVKTGKIKFVPQSYENLYYSWMDNIQDWCISRQLWWGHQIPAWYDKQGNVYVGYSKEEVCQHYNLDISIELEQDQDVLDTWFSSALWSFSPLDWPNSSEILKHFHPTNVLVTGFDIIFFWVARMIMFTMHFLKNPDGTPQVPFKDIYMTGLVRDENGQKMSKSKGNVIDPLDMIDGIDLAELIDKSTVNLMQPQLAAQITKDLNKKFPEGIKSYGTDALRFTLAALASNGRDINWDMQRLEGYRNFCNKLWNASRFVLLNLEGVDLSNLDPSTLNFSEADLYIQGKLINCFTRIQQNYDNYRIDAIASDLYEFIWNQYCDWYLELAKLQLKSGTPQQILATQYTLAKVLDASLKMAHPLIPYITEEIWDNLISATKLPHQHDSLMLEAFPQAAEFKQDLIATQSIEWSQGLITLIRNFRAEINLAPNKSLDIELNNLNKQELSFFNSNKTFIANLTKSNISVVEQLDQGLVQVKLYNLVKVQFLLGSTIDKTTELARLQSELEKLDFECQRLEEKLNNQNFINKAKPELVTKEREKLANYQQQQSQLQEQYQKIEKL